MRSHILLHFVGIAKENRVRVDQLKLLGEFICKTCASLPCFLVKCFSMRLTNNK